MKKFTSGLKDCFKSLFHPYSPLITLLVGGLISSYVNVVKVSLNNILYGLGVWFIIACAYQIHSNIMKTIGERIEKYREQISNLKSIVVEKERQIKTNVGLIEAKYGEFSQYLKIDKYNLLCKKIVNKYSYIDAVHIYNYTVGTNTANVEIKINFDTGVEYEGININVMKQKYFIISKKTYLNFLEIQKLYIKIKQSDLYNIEEIKQVFITKSFELFAILTQELNSVNNRIFILVVEMLKSIDCENNYGQLIENDKDDYIRTGILGSILSNSDYIYSYNKTNKEKVGRTYFSFNDIIDGENKIVTLVINSNSIDINNQEQLIKNVISYYEEIYGNHLK